MVTKTKGRHTLEQTICLWGGGAAGMPLCMFSCFGDVDTVKGGFEVSAM